eukprot:scaffold888_cov246-Pinguiococcus_pyrenoidosus.AAC.17
MRRGTFTRAVRKGIPAELRPRVWWHCSGAAQKREHAEAVGKRGSYRRFFDASEKPIDGALDQTGIVEATYETLQSWIVNGEVGKVAHDIEKDLTRTFPTNANFEGEEGLTITNSLDAGASFPCLGSSSYLGLASMRRVLLAYSLRNTVVGYCQSMNFLCAILLLHYEEEEHAFWVLAALIEDILPDDYFTPSMLGSRTDNAVFQVGPDESSCGARSSKESHALLSVAALPAKACLRWKLPRIYHHCEALSIPVEPITCSWFLCAFVNTLPLRIVLRVWDILFHEGSKVIFRVALAVLSLREDDILGTNDFQTVYDILRKPASPGEAPSSELLVQETVPSLLCPAVDA